MDFKQISVHDAPERSPGFLLWHISTSWRSSIETTLKSLGLTHPQFVVLATIGWLTRKGDGVTQAAVGKMAGMDPNTVSQVIKGLILKKWVQRKSATDARAKNPVLTSLGKEVIAKALPAVEKKDAQFFNNLSTKEMQLLIQVFQKLIL
ncbi:MAG: MarR family transcriptional regulator [Verrucomicrobia bacterium]|nr:MarR family transcriptional regulator [Verrucomicrobiota bacterium]